MGDDAELWIESGGDPTTLISDDYWRDSRYKSNKTTKQKNTMVFIDAESVSVNHCHRIVAQCKSIGEIFEMRYYALQKEGSTVEWDNVAKQYSIKPILMCEQAVHNKIDNKIIKDIKDILETNKSIDIFCIAARDGEYSEVIEYIRSKKKRVVILATKNTSPKLKNRAIEIRGI